MPLPRVLLADDSATVRALARLELESAGYEVLEAANGAQALALAQESLPDVVLLDVEMPVLDGYATVQALKADPLTADIPVVFLTGRVAAEDVVRALQLGAHDYLRKPPEPAELLARVSAALRVKVLQDELRKRADELEKVSRTDYLTGLANRRHAEDHLRAVSAEAARYGYPMAVLLVDVDHFKRVNDDLGHGAGDDVLKALASRLQGALRSGDLVGRWGGEEFIVVLPHSDVAAARTTAERLRACITASPVPSATGAVAVSISVGGAAAEGPGEHDLLHLADQQLYAAKDAGRDCVRVVRSEGVTGG